jgi:hypothetical protein
VNENGVKLTSNTAESRTDVIADSLDPEWNREFLLKIDGKTDIDSSHSGPVPFGKLP